MKVQVKICKCGRFYKWGEWFTFHQLSQRDQFLLLTAYNNCLVEEVIETCNVCQEISQEVVYGVFGL